MSIRSRLLLLSNSTMSGTQYMEWSQTLINQFLTNKVKNIIFIPFAAVSFDWNTYEEKVQKGLPQFQITSIHRTDNYKEAITKAEAILVGGGNTFHLLFKLQEFDLIETIRNRVLNEGIPYVGWSAGSNVAAPDIGSTNDMPIIWPKTDRAFGLVPYNINPHYNEWKPDKYQGEGRNDRLDECLIVKKRPIVAISEGIAIHVENGKHVIVAPELKSTDCLRCVKIWLPNGRNEKGLEVVDVKFGEDIAPIVC